MNNEPRLTAIVPIGNLVGNTENITFWLSELGRYEIKVILVASNLFPETCKELENFLSTAEIEGKYELIIGAFDNPGTSRNVGLTKAKSEWVAFWDADDLPNIENITAQIEDNVFRQSEIIIGSFRVVDSKTKSIREILNTNNLDQNNKMLSQNPGIWRWVFRRDAILDIRFPENRMGEDQVFLAKTLFWSKSVQFSSNIFYDYYVNHKGQLTGNVDAINDLPKSLNLMIELEKEFKSDFLRTSCFRMSITILKKSSIRNKLKALLVFMKFSRRTGLLQTARTLISLATSRG